MNLFNDELEQMIIGSAILRESLTVDMRSLSTLDFFVPQYIRLWAKAIEIDEDGEQITPIELHRRCVESYPAWQMGISDITNLTFGLPGDVRAKDLKHFRGLATARRMRREFQRLSDTLEESADVASVIAEAEKALAALRRESDITDGTAKQLVEVLESDVYPRLDKFVSGETVKMPFGFNALDEVTNGGTGLGELVVLGAKPKMGKSALTLQIAAYQSMMGITSLLVSREMLNFENGFRFLAQNSRFTNNVFRPQLLRNTAEELKTRGREHNHLPLFFDDRSKKVSEIRRQTKTLKETNNLQTVFVDYAQLVRPETRHNNRAEDLEAIYYDLKEMAQDLEVAVYVNAQFNRQGIRAERPSMSDFDGSSAAEKAGNLILLWQIENQHSQIVDGKPGRLWIEAGRNVGTDEFGIVFHGAHSRFSFD